MTQKFLADKEIQMVWPLINPFFLVEKTAWIFNWTPLYLMIPGCPLKNPQQEV